MRIPSLPVLGAIVGAALLVVSQTFFVVDQSHQALVLRFGEIQRYANVGTGGAPGLYVKIPFVENRVLFDRRNLSLPMPETTIVAADQENLIVDAMVRWRIRDPLRFYESAGTEEQGQSRLQNFTEAALRRVLGAAASQDIISNRRGALMQAIRADLNRSAATELGVEIIDVRIRQADLPTQTQARVFERMISERQRVAAGIRAQGNEEAARIRADADRQVTVIQATAREEAARLQGEGDADRARIFARAYGRNPSFAAFYRSLQAYEQAVREGTPMVIAPDSEFFRFMRSSSGGR